MEILFKEKMVEAPVLLVERIVPKEMLSHDGVRYRQLVYQLS